MTRLGGLVSVLVLAGFAAACSGRAEHGAAAPSAGTDAGDLGKTLAGETCRSQIRSGPPPVPNVALPLDILCGDGKEPTGVVWVDALPIDTPVDPAQRRAAVERVSRETFEGRSVALRMECSPAEAVGGDPNVLLSSCVPRVGSWPQIVLVVASGSSLYQSEGLPSMLPVLAAAIDKMAGAPAIAGDAQAGLQAAETRLAAGTGKIGSGDLAKYNEAMELGRLYNNTRNFAASEESFRRALEIQTRVFGADTVGAAEVLIEVALEVSNVGRYDEAGGLFRRAEPAVAKASDSIRARFYAYLALDAANQHNYDAALAYAQQSTALRRQGLDSGADALAAITASDPHTVARGELAHSLMIEAALQLKLENLTDAQAAISEALQILGNVRGLPLGWRAEGVLLLGQIEAAEGRATSAELNLREGAALEERIFGNTAPTARAYLTLGRFYQSQQLNSQAVTAFGRAMEILAHNEAARSALTADQVIPFLAAASAVAERDGGARAQVDAEAFRATQVMASDVGDQAITRASARLAAGDPALADLVREQQEAEREREAARIELANEQAKPDELRGKAVEDDLAKRRDDAAARADALQRKLRQTFPSYANFSTPDAIELAKLQQRLEPDEALLSFVIGREGSFTLLVRQNRFIARPVAVTHAELSRDVVDLRKAFVPRLGTLPDYDLKAAYQLYKKLIGPVEAGLEGVHHLIVVPAGALSSLPMELLVTAPPAPGAERAYRGAEWLIRRVALSEVPSVRAFLDLREARAQAKPAPRPFLGVGNPSFAGTSSRDLAPGTASALDKLAETCRDKGPVPAALIKALAPLPETADEVRRVAQLLHADPGSILLGGAATEANLRRQPLGDYDVLYFATHGLLPGELRCDSEPGLALSPPDGAASSTDDDGLLDASEIARFRLNADLVVLSACNTGAGGGRFGGESLSGLAEAFFYAGARTLVVSHWQVASGATAQLMTGMFERLGPRMEGGVAESLRKAQLALANEAQTAHPFYWAAFTVIGDGGQPGAGTGRVASNGASASGAPGQEVP